MRSRIRAGSGGGGFIQAVWNGNESVHWTNDLFAPGVHVSTKITRVPTADLGTPGPTASTIRHLMPGLAGIPADSHSARAPLCRSDGGSGQQHSGRRASPWAKGGVGISVSFNTRSVSPVSVKINALSIPLGLRRRPDVLRLREQEAELVMKKNDLRRTCEMLHPSHGLCTF